MDLKFTTIIVLEVLRHEIATHIELIYIIVIMLAILFHTCVFFDLAFISCRCAAQTRKDGRKETNGQRTHLEVVYMHVVAVIRSINALDLRLWKIVDSLPAFSSINCRIDVDAR